MASSSVPATTMTMSSLCRPQQHPFGPASPPRRPNYLPNLKPLRVSNPNPQPLAASVANSTRTVRSLISAAGSVASALSKWMVQQPSPEEVTSLRNLQSSLVWSAGPLFFAAKGLDLSFTASPLKVVAAGMGKWLEIYSGILMLRVLFSWFPNIPWDKQPLSAIRDLCDPYLNLFRNVIPPLYSLDLSPLLAFAILGVLTSLLNTPPS